VRYALVIVCSQNPETLDELTVWKSMSPWKSVEFVPPSVKTPPGSSSEAVGSLEKRVMKKENSGSDSSLLLMSACQKGADSVLAMPSNPRPMMPASWPSINPELKASTATGTQVSIADGEIKTQDPFTAGAERPGPP
jgi:hypothetical protein